MRTRTILTAGALAALTGPTLWADILRVPSQYPTIQSAIDAASNGDTVLIADGVYTGPGNKNLDFGGRAITVESENGRENCIIDCEQDGRGFHFRNGEGQDSAMKGLTVRNAFVDETSANGPFGGAVLCESSGPAIIDCEFAASWARESSLSYGGGGGVACLGGTTTIRDCAFEECSGGDGGAILLQDSDATIESCTFRSCHACNGGGIAVLDSAVTINRCVFDGNNGSRGCGSGGGGVFASGSSAYAEILRCLFIDQRGGTAALFLDAPSALVRDCEFELNQATDFPGAVQDLGAARIERCRFTRNKGNFGVVRCAAGTVVKDCVFNRNSGSHASPGAALTVVKGTRVIGCTIVRNGALGRHAAINGGLATITNCVLWDNGAEAIQATSVISHSVVEGGWPGEGNIDADPRFVDLLNGDLHLLPDSPAIDAGDPTYTAMSGEADIDGQLRVWNGRIDMGADEFGSFVYGDLNCDGALDAFDIEPFILALTDPQQYAVQHPGCQAILADLNGDGVVDAFDISPFIDVLTGQ